MSVRSIVVNAAPLFASPDSSVQLETQCLFGEQFDSVREQDGFAFGRLLTDDYEGWIPVAALGKKTTPTHRLAAPSSWLRTQRDIKSTSLMSLTMGSLLYLLDTHDDACEVLVGGKKRYLPSAHVVELHQRQADWVATAELFLGAPYVWGGRMHHGLDCSALVQLATQTAQISLPRNTSQQQHEGITIDDSSALRRGDLVFWQGHVGVMQSQDQLLHANAHHMQVFSEPLNKAIARIDKTMGPVTARRRLAHASH